MLFDGRGPGWLAGWWESYVRLIADPVLDAYFRHGVVLEPHLQNALVGIDGDGRPAQAIFRDLEGLKLARSAGVDRMGLRQARALRPRAGLSRARLVQGLDVRRSVR